jgi:thiamine biosynthesis lipoprotein
MKQTRLLMGMPITVEIVDAQAQAEDIDAVFAFFDYVDKKFSTYKPASEISRINRGLSKSKWSRDMRTVLQLCEQTKQLAHGYFDIAQGEQLDPSGLVKGWAIQKTAELLKKRGFKHFYIEAGGDTQVSGRSAKGKPWTIGIRSPFNRNEIIKTIVAQNEGIATSGSYIRGQHVYNPLRPGEPLTDIVSLTVIGPNIFEADRFATAAFAMGKKGIYFLENLNGYEAYMIDNSGKATLTSGFERYEKSREMD